MFMATSGYPNDGRVPGQRRQKLLGYVKAANELRQSYQQSLSTKWQESDYQDGMPGGFPETDIVRSGDEEMLLFPSYARKHAKASHPSQEGFRAMPGAREELSSPETGDAEYWRREWQKYEDDNAIVDVDVRGWIYTPQRGPLTRRNRLLVAIARRLSGVPAPNNSPSHSRESSLGPAWRERTHDSMMSQEEEVAAREAELIERHGQKEVEAASRGRYAADNNSLIDFSPTNSRPSSPRPTASRSTTATDFEGSDSASLSVAQKRTSWNLSQQMSRDEIMSANELLMSRLRPFMTMPLANTPITIFFYNDEKSQSKTVHTDDSGHFKVRAALDFVPSKVRVLASEKLSATEDVMVTDERGISMVSDIDDTIKHSAIASGAKEIFKNTFIRELKELTVPGVKEWYTKMANMGVRMHYVSNSPWQLYPLLRSYFQLAGLPSGSFHLKQYTGMLQGIFEPAAERKKGSLDRIMHDFPQRKFILVGDSGEADLEVYTDIVQEHPGRVLAVFIRDVTSKDENNLKDFFYGAHPGGRPSGSRSSSANATDRRKQLESKPELPERPKPPTSTVTDDLIDFSEDVPKSESPQQMYNKDIEELQTREKTPPQRPAKPPKPSNLRSMTTASPPPPANANSLDSSIRRTSEGDTSKYAPPPPAPRRTATGLSNVSATSKGSNGSERYYAHNADKVAPPPPPAPRSSRTLWQDSSHASPAPPLSPANPNPPGVLSSARAQLSQAYNALPALRSQTSNSSLNSNSDPRRGLSSYPAAAARFVTGATGGDPSAGGDGGAPGQPYDKKLEMWKRRWARAEDILGSHGVVLRHWRNGSDVMDECERIVEEEFMDMDRRAQREERSGRGR